MTKIDAPAIDGLIDIAKVRSVYYASESISTKRDIGAILDCVPKAVRSITQSKRLVVALVDKESSGVKPTAIRHTCPFPSDLMPTDDRKKIARQVMETNKTLLITKEGRAIFHHPDNNVSNTDIVFTVVPLSTSGRSIGFLSVVAPDSRPFDNADVFLLTILAGQVAAAVQSVRLHDRIDRLARAEERARLTRELLSLITMSPEAPQTGRALFPKIQLTDKERQVLSLMARGYTNEEISRDMWISPKTVKTHVSRILRKLGKRNRIEAIVHALKIGLVDLET